MTGVVANVGRVVDGVRGKIPRRNANTMSSVQIQGNVEVVRALYDAYNRRDLGVIAAYCASDITLYQTELLPWGGHYAGLEGVQRFVGSLVQHLDSRVTMEQFIPAGDRVVAVGRTVGTVRANGSAFDVPAVHVWTLAGGKVTRVEYYIDTPAMWAALGAA
jgi:ketosteroid isomerase-like protein